MRHLALTTFIAAVALAAPATAQTYTWTGAGGNSNWSTAANWTGGTPVSADNTVIELNNTTQTTTTQDIANPFTLNQLNMLTDATNGFVVNGGTLRFAGGSAQISNDAAAVLQVNTGIDFSVNTTIDMTRNNVGGREVHLTGPLTAATGTTVTVTSSNGTPGVIALLEGSNNPFNGTLAVTNNTTVQTTGANTLARSATVTTSQGLSTFFVGRLSDSGLAAAGANAQLGAFTGQGQLNLGDATITSSALVGFNNNALDTVSGNLGVGNVNSHLGKVGTGEWRFTGLASVVNGGFSVRDGLVNFQGSTSNDGGFGTNSTGAIRVYDGSELRFTLTGTGTNSRLGDTQSVTLAGGTLRLAGSGLGTTATGFDEVAGALNIGAGQSVVQIDTAAGRGARFNFASLANTTTTGTVTFLSNNLGGSDFNTAGAGNVAFASTAGLPLVGGTPGYLAASTNLQIIANATAGTTTGGVPTTFVAYDATNASVRGLETSNYEGNFDGLDTSNVSLAGGTTSGSGETANALRMTNGANLSNSGTLTLTSGALLNNGGGNVTGTGTLQFGATGNLRTAYITTNGPMAISNNIQASNLSKNGAGNLTLTAATNLSLGTVAVNAGTLTLANTATITAPNAVFYQVSRGATLDVSAFNTAPTAFTLTPTNTIAGSGTVTGNLVVNGTIAPSALGGPNGGLLSPGTLTVNGNVALNGGSRYAWTANSAVTNGDNTSDPFVTPLSNLRSPYTASLLSITGNLNLNGATEANRINLDLRSLTLANEFGGLYDLQNVGESRSWVLIEAGSITGFSADKFAINAFTFDGSFGDIDPTRLSVHQVGNSIVLSYNFTPVPEPGSMLAVCGVVAASGLVWRRLRRRPVADTPATPA